LTISTSLLGAGEPTRTACIDETNAELTAKIDEGFSLERYREALTRADGYRRPGKVLFRFDG
jgi:hypothetical protein